MKIIFEDQAICVIDKPSGMVVDEVQVKFPTMILAHRLDRDTSGVMLLAKTPEAYEALKKQFMERKIKKTYMTLVHGAMKEQEGIISVPIESNPKDRTKRVVGTNLSRMAVTEWKVLEVLRTKNEVLSLLEVKPLTGRTHQIRVHLKHLEHRIVSDPIYGGRKQYKEDIKWCPRLFLHARRIEFLHPTTGRVMEFESDLDEELQKVVKGLESV